MKKVICLVAMIVLTGISINVHAVPQLSSYPSARAVIFLDFDGQIVSNTIWNNGDEIDCLPALLSDNQILEIFNRVSEDYRPFNLNITTDSAVYLNAPITQRTRVIITPTNYWRRGPGGIAYIGSFTLGEETPCFVFTTIVGEQNIKALAEVISHESGHTLGLQHQSSYDDACNLTSVYNGGTGIGETAWAPIMGTGNERNFSLWNYGPTQKGCGQKQDNLYFITHMNGFDYRSDDHGDEIVHATNIPLDAKQFIQSGIITTIQDVDIFQFKLDANGVFQLHANPFNVGPNNEGADLDIAISLLNANGDTIAFYNPESSLSATIDTVLQAGTYFVAVDGTGNVNTLNDYGSLGSYTISGEFTSNTSIMPISRIILKGFTDKNHPVVKWQVDTEDPINIITLERSTDKINFFPVYSTISKQATRDLELSSPNEYYRLKVSTNSGHTRYSEIIKLDKANTGQKNFTIKYLSQHELAISTDRNYSYRIFDSNGRLLNEGKGSGGTSRISLHNLPLGLYWIQLMNVFGSTTEKVMKR